MLGLAFALCNAGIVGDVIIVHIFGIALRILGIGCRMAVTMGIIGIGCIIGVTVSACVKGSGTGAGVGRGGGGSDSCGSFSFLALLGIELVKAELLTVRVALGYRL